jgi:hypothetical protein
MCGLASSVRVLLPLLPWRSLADGPGALPVLEGLLSRD